MAASWLNTRRTRGAKRRQRILSAAGVTAPPEGLVQLRKGCADAEGLHAPDSHTRPTGMARRCRSAGVHRPGHAGSEASKNVGSPRGSCSRAGQARDEEGRDTHRRPLGCLITQRTPRWGPPTPGGRTGRKYAARTGNFCRPLSARPPRSQPPCGVSPTQHALTSNTGFGICLGAWLHPCYASAGRPCTRPLPVGAIMAQPRSLP